jgi:hypothetical protein
MKYIFTVYTTDGREFESSAQELDNVDKGAVIELFSDLKNLKHFAMGVVDALGRESKVYFHPEKIVAIRLTEATLS